MKNMNDVLRQAQQMQAKITLLRKELDAREIEVNAGGGMLKITINGKQEITKLTLDPSCFQAENHDSLPDLIKVGINEAIKQSKEMVEKAMNKVTGGISLPGLF